MPQCQVGDVITPAVCCEMTPRHANDADALRRSLNNDTRL
jgi:hypothetical protein